MRKPPFPHYRRYGLSPRRIIERSWKEIVCFFQDGNFSRRFVTALNPALEQKKTTLTDAAEIKAVNKQINALQEEFGRLRKEIQYRRSYEKSVEREFFHSMVGDE